MSIADKLTTIAENEQKVYEAGQKLGEDNGFAIAESVFSHGYTDYSAYFEKSSFEKAPSELLRHTSSGTNFTNMFKSCSALKEVPQFDTSSGTSFYAMFTSCSALESVPMFDTSSGTDTAFMFSQCSALKEVPQFDFSKTTGAKNMFYGCSALKEVPQFTFRGICDCSYMFQNCTSLQALPSVKLGDKANYAFSGCSALTEVNGQLDTSTVSDMTGLFQNCTSLKEVVELDICSAATQIFNGCSALEKVATLNTKLKNCNYMFNNCSSLHTIEGIDFTNVTLFNNVFTGCTALTNLTINGSIKRTGLSLADSINLTHESLISVINALYDYSTSTSTYKITFGSTNLAKLTDEEKQIMTDKGWTYA